MAFIQTTKFLEDVGYSEVEFASAFKNAIEKEVTYLISGNDITLLTFGTLVNGYFVEFVGNETYTITNDSIKKYVEVEFNTTTKTANINVVTSPSTETATLKYNIVMVLINTGIVQVLKNKTKNITNFVTVYDKYNLNLGYPTGLSFPNTIGTAGTVTISNFINFNNFRGRKVRVYISSSNVDRTRKMTEFYIADTTSNQTTMYIENTLDTNATEKYENLLYVLVNNNIWNFRTILWKQIVQSTGAISTPAQNPSVVTIDRIEVIYENSN